MLSGLLVLFHISMFLSRFIFIHHLYKAIGFCRSTYLILVSIILVKVRNVLVDQACVIVLDCRARNTRATGCLLSKKFVCSHVKHL